MAARSPHPLLTSLLAHGRFRPVLAAACVLLALPSLAVGLQYDDYAQRTLLRQADFGTSLSRLFVFMDGDPSRALSQMERGAFPWFALPQGKVAFWRPLSALTHWVDYRLWPAAPWLMHLHSLAWYAALVWAAASFYRRFIPEGRAAALAAVLYALDDARGYALGWLANRNVLLAATFGLLALLAHDNWRRKGGGLWLAASLACLGAGLLAGEAAVAVSAYLLAYAVCIDPASRRARFLSLLPAAIVVLLWRLLYQSLGYGLWGTAYVDPNSQPLEFFAAVVERAPVLLMAQWMFPPAELYAILAPPSSTAVWLAAVAFTLSFGWWLSQRAHSPAAAFFLSGSMLSLIPPSASLPANRLLFFVGLGAFGFVAGLIAESAAGRRRPAGLHWLAGFHLLQCLAFPLVVLSPAISGTIEPSLVSLPTDSAFRTQTAVFINAPSPFHLAFIGDVLPEDRQPARIRCLAPGLGAVTVSRPDSHTLLVQPEGGYLAGFDLVYRGRGQAFAPGDMVRLSDVTVTIVTLTADGRPAAVTFRFSTSLEDRALRWLQWRDGVYVPFQPPPIGDTVVLSPIPVFAPPW